MARIRLIPAQEKQIIRLYTDKKWPWSLTQLGDAFGISGSGINKVLIRHGVEKRPRGPVLAVHRASTAKAAASTEKAISAREKQIVRLYTDENAPWSAKRIRLAYRVGSGTLNKVLERHGVELRSKDAKGLFKPERIAA
jgi:hypothetical protein